MSEFKNCEKVYVSDISIEEALKLKMETLFIGIREDRRNVCENPKTHMLTVWKYIVKIPKKKLVPYTLETLPRCHVTVKQGEHVESTLTGRYGIGVLVGGLLFTYEDLMYLDISFDYGETWQRGGLYE